VKTVVVPLTNRDDELDGTAEGVPMMTSYGMVPYPEMVYVNPGMLASIVVVLVIVLGTPGAPDGDPIRTCAGVGPRAGYVIVNGAAPYGSVLVGVMVPVALLTDSGVGVGAVAGVPTTTVAAMVPAALTVYVNPSTLGSKVVIDVNVTPPAGLGNGDPITT